MAVLALLAFIALSLMEIVTPAVVNGRWASAWNGFIGGVSTAAVGFLTVGIIFNRRALRNEKTLRKQYIKEHDERSEEICRRSGHSSYWFDAAGLLLGVVVGGYFNPVVSITCLGCLLYVCVVRGLLKAYYSKKI